MLIQPPWARQPAAGGFMFHRGNLLWLPFGSARLTQGLGVGAFGVGGKWPSGLTTLAAPVTMPLPSSYLANGATMVALVQQDASDTQGGESICSVHSGTDYNWLTLRVNSAAHWDQGVQLRDEANGNQTGVFTSVKTVGVPRFVAGTISAGGTSLAAFVDDQVLTASRTVTWSLSGGYFSVGGVRRQGGSYTEQFFGLIFGAALIPRELSAVDIRRLRANFWQLFPPRPRRLWALLGGGTTHNVTLTESAAAAETVARVLSAAAALAEAAAAADAGSSQLAAPVALTEPASAAEAAAAQRVGFVVVTEAAAVADSATTGSVATGALSEALTPTDAATSTAVFAVSAAEIVSAADAASAIAARVAPLAEALSAADTITVTAVQAGAVGEALGLADAYTTGPVTSATLAEAASLTDAVGVALAAVAAASESVAAADGVVVVLSASAAQLEPAALADLVASVRTTLATLTEPAAAADTASAADGVVHSAGLAEVLAVADLVAALGLVVYVRDRMLVIAADPRALVIAADPRTFDVRPS